MPTSFLFIELPAELQHHIIRYTLEMDYDANLAHFAALALAETMPWHRLFILKHLNVIGTALRIDLDWYEISCPPEGFAAPWRFFDEAEKLHAEKDVLWKMIEALEATIARDK